MAPFRKDLITVVELPVYKIGFADLKSRLFGGSVLTCVQKRQQ